MCLMQQLSMSVDDLCDGVWMANRHVVVGGGDNSAWNELQWCNLETIELLVKKIAQSGNDDTFCGSESSVYAGSVFILGRKEGLSSDEPPLEEE